MNQCLRARPGKTGAGPASCYVLDSCIASHQSGWCRVSGQFINRAGTAKRIAWRRRSAHAELPTCVVCSRSVHMHAFGTAHACTAAWLTREKETCDLPRSSHDQAWLVTHDETTVGCRRAGALAPAAAAPLEKRWQRQWQKQWLAGGISGRPSWVTRESVTVNFVCLCCLGPGGWVWDGTGRSKWTSHRDVPGARRGREHARSRIVAHPQYRTSDDRSINRAGQGRKKGRGIWQIEVTQVE
jgi:hypothetical protein